MRVLVTGASGFVGKAVVAELMGRGHRVLALYGSKTAFPESTDHQIEYARADVSVRDSLRDVEQREAVDAVIHAAGMAHRFGKTEEGEYTRVNVDGVGNVADSAAKLGARRFVLISSVLVYGRKDRVAGKMVTEEDACYPADVYARSKLDGEVRAAEACRSNGLLLSILRPAPIIGEGSKGNFARLISAVHRGRFLWIGDGSNLKSLVYVGDVARAAVHLVENSDKRHEVFNLAAEPSEMRNIVGRIALRLNKNPPKLKIPAAPIRQFVRLARFTPFKDVSNRFSGTLETWLAEDIYSSERFFREYSLGSLLSIPDGIDREISYYLSNK